MEIRVTKVSKGISSVLGELTHPVKDSTAKHYSIYFYINTANVICWRVFKADIPSHVQSEVTNYIKHYQQTH